MLNTLEIHKWQSFVIFFAQVQSDYVTSCCTQETTNANIHQSLPATRTHYENTLSLLMKGTLKADVWSWQCSFLKRRKTVSALH